MLRYGTRCLFLLVALVIPTWATASTPLRDTYDIVIKNGLIYDGSGGVPFLGDVSIQGDRITYVGPHSPREGREQVDAQRKAVAPGFVNMFSHTEQSLLQDGRGLSDLRQGVTLEVMGEASMGPLTAQMKESLRNRQSDFHYDVDWTTLGEYLEKLERHGITPNIASFVGAGTVRMNVVGESDAQVSAPQLDAMRALVRHAMEEGALGVTTALIYPPNSYASTAELIELAKESARCGGMYTAHIRSEANKLLEAVQETVDIAKASGGPAEIYHLKAAGESNWGKLDAVIRSIETARASGVRITANMYTYTAGATGLNAAMPPWVQKGGFDAWTKRLGDPGVRSRVIADMRDPTPSWENLYAQAGPSGVLLLQFKNPALRPLIGKTLDQVAQMRSMSPEETAIDLVRKDGSSVLSAYFFISEDNVRREVALPWVGFGSDAAAIAPEGEFLQASAHPRTYGNFARVLAKYVREEKILKLEQAIHRLSAMPAANLSLFDRGMLKAGYFADVVVFDPHSIQDHATYEQPHQLATGIRDVWINGIRALRNGEATGAASGRVVRGRAWVGRPGGGCRSSSHVWTWSSGS